MAGTITALRFQKHNPERVNVYLDGQFAFGLAAIEAARLRVGQALSDDEIARLQGRDEIEQAYERALNFLSYRPRSESEVRNHLRNKGVQPETIAAVIERLTQAGLLDDRAFARYWIENRQQFNPRGARALRYELQEKGVPAATIAEVLAGLEEATTGDAARAVAEAAIRKLSHLPPRDFRRKLAEHLARRGFSYDEIQPLIEEALRMRTYSDDTESEASDNGQ